MSLFEFCIRRPVFSTVLSLVLLLLGIVSYGRLTVREYPNVDEPVVSVKTSYPGASASIIESQITQVLEGSIAGIAGIDVLVSTSRSEESRITVRFRSDVDPDVAASDVRDRVARVRRRLPVEVQEPTIARVEADAEPILQLVFTSDRMNALEITDYVDRFVLDRLKNLNGVADVEINGERRYAMRIWIDRERLAAFSLTVQDVENALKAQNVDLPSGRIESRDREFSVLSRTGLTTPRAVPQHHHQDRRRPPGEARRGGARGAGRRRRTPRQPLQRQGRHQRRHHQAGGGEPARTSPRPCASCCRRSASRCRKVCR